LGGHDFGADPQDPEFISILSSLRRVVKAGGGLNAAGQFVAPNTTL
jgi:hypothetical protein